jgi:hypothetical protein
MLTACVCVWGGLDMVHVAVCRRGVGCASAHEAAEDAKTLQSIPVGMILLIDRLLPLLPLLLRCHYCCRCCCHCCYCYAGDSCS